MQAKQLNLVPLNVMVLVLSAVATIAIVGKSFGIVFNVTGSMHDLMYKIGHGEKGSLVSFCSPIPHPAIGQGSCPDGSMPLIKRVAGVSGDLVTETDQGVEINGQPVPNSRPFDLDTRGQALPHVRGIFTLKPGEIWTAGDHPNSFDSRYFGPVKFPRGDHATLLNFQRHSLYRRVRSGSIHPMGQPTITPRSESLMVAYEA